MQISKYIILVFVSTCIIAEAAFPDVNRLTAFNIDGMHLKMSLGDVEKLLTKSGLHETFRIRDKDNHKDLHLYLESSDKRFNVTFRTLNMDMPRIKEIIIQYIGSGKIGYGQSSKFVESIITDFNKRLGKPVMIKKNKFGTTASLVWSGAPNRKANSSEYPSVTLNIGNFSFGNVLVILKDPHPWED